MTSTITFGVIIKIPVAEDGDDVRGNLCAAFELYQVTGRATEKTGYLEPVVLVNPVAALVIREPVFKLGEILVMQCDREVGGLARKPSKWDVTCEEFKTVEEAVARAEQLR